MNKDKGSKGKIKGINKIIKVTDTIDLIKVIKPPKVAKKKELPEDEFLDPQPLETPKLYIIYITKP